MKITLKVGDAPARAASEMLLGQNIETCWDTVPGLLADRLDNAKFLGPPHALTGVAPGWEGGSCSGGLNHKLSPGTGMMGSEAHLLRGSGAGLTQNKRRVARGETLVAELWARTMGQPATVTVSLLPMPASQKAYATAEITIDCPQYKRYTAELTAPVDDDDACFAIGVHGEGSVWLDQAHLRPKGEDLLCAGMIEQMAAMKIPALRFPGGIVSTNYNWRHGTGPVHLRPAVNDAAFYRDWHIYYDFGTDEYLQLCLDQGIAPAITVNLGTGNADEARGWAEYAAAFFRGRGVEPPPAYWHIGNHPYHATMAWMTSDMYVQTVREYVPAIREAYPNARIVGVAPGPGADEEGEWLEKTLDNVGDMLDVIQCQTYGMQGIQPRGIDPEQWAAGTADPAEMMANLVTNTCALQGTLGWMIASCRKRDLATNVGIAEWNYWISASHRDGHFFYEPDDALHALFIAGMLNGFTALAPDLEVAHYYNLVNCMGILIHRGPGVTVHAGAEVFELFRPAFPGEVLPVETDAPKLGDGTAVSVSALRADGNTYLFAVNYSATESASLDLEGFGGAPSKVTCMAAEDPRTRPEPADVAAGNTVDLPPLSVARLDWPGTGS